MRQLAVAAFNDHTIHVADSVQSQHLQTVLVQLADYTSVLLQKHNLNVTAEIQDIGRLLMARMSIYVQYGGSVSEDIRRGTTAAAGSSNQISNTNWQKMSG